MSSSSGTVYRPGSFMAFFRHRQERLRGDIQVWTQTPRTEIYDWATSRRTKPGPFRKSPRPQLREKFARQKKSINSHARIGRKKVRRKQRNKDICRFGMNFEGEGGYISKQMLGSLHGTDFAFPADEN